MRVGLSEAVDLLRKWSSESALLRCDFSFPFAAAVFRVRVVFVSEAEVKFLSDDTFSEMSLRLPRDAEFALPVGTFIEYTEPRGFPEEARIFESALIFYFPPDGNDFISLTVIIER